MNPDAVALVAHDVYTDIGPVSGIEGNTAVNLAHFSATLKAIQSAGFRFTTLSEFVECRRKRQLALLTFDDAYRSIYDLVFPILCENKIPAVVFVVSQTLTEQRDPFPIWLLSLRNGKSRIKEHPIGELESIPLIRGLLHAANSNSLFDLLSRPLPQVVEAFRRQFDSQQLATIGSVVADLAPDLRLTMTRSHLLEMTASRLVELGAHSCTHRSFASLAADEIKTEIIDSTKAIGQFSRKHSCEIPFAYPYGALTVSAKRIVADFCFAGFTCKNRPLHHLDARAAIPRINIDDQTLSRVFQSTSMDRLKSFTRETLHLHARTGPLWKVIGPAVQLYRRPTKHNAP